MPEQPFDNDSTGDNQHAEQPHNEYDESSPANNNEQSGDQEDDEQ
ncbi:unnamed protein product, partial [Rotaria magnacalcarata]